MECATCGHLSPPDATFCSSCGAPLRSACPNCGRVNPDGAVFCIGCGTRLQASDQSPDGTRGGERRHLTVMFCDLVDSTRLAGELDPEDMRDLVIAYQRACSDAIAQFSGFVAQYLGDGVLAYFGYPDAHEDDARLAVAAGSTIVASVAELGESLGRDDIAARVGLHTGEVVVMGTSVTRAGHKHDIVGETPSIAARLQSAARPGSVIISDQTRQLVEGFFSLEPTGDLVLKGVSRPVPAFQVLGATEARTRLDAGVGRGLTPFVGREAQFHELLADWREVGQSAGRVVLLSGEPGIGKSRLAHELLRHASASGSSTLRLRCSPYNTRSTLFPFVEHLLRVAGGGEREPAEPGRRLDELEAHLAQLGMDPKVASPRIAELLTIPDDGRYPASSDSADRRKRRTLEVLFSWVLAHARHEPLVAVIEDVQWIDPTTLELLSGFFGAESVPGVLLVLTHRADYVPPWVHRSHVRHIALERLGSEAIRAIVHELTGGRALPSELETAIGARTDGVPLFVEEVTHAVLESGCVEERAGRLVAAATLPERLVPSTLRESLMARLDGLGEARDVAQVLSVVRREASFELLCLVADLDEHELETGLDRLVETDLARRRHSLAGESYVLKHWLVQDVAYESLLRSARRRYHERIATALPAKLPEIVETQPEFLAYHLIQAGQEGQAISYLLRAGLLAHRRSANTEAIEHLHRALELVRGQPAADRDRLELAVLNALGAPLTAAKGYSVPEVERVYTRAGELCRALGDDETPEFFRALYGTWRVHFMSAAYTRALEFGHQLLRLAETSGNGTQLAAAHRALASTLFYLGDDPASAHEHLTRVINSTALERNRTSFIDELHDVVDPWITCHAYQAWALWMTGRPTEARKMSDRALSLSKDLQHPFTRALALSFDSWLCQWQGDVDAVFERARDALAVAKEQGFAFWIGWDEIMLGWAQTASGDHDEGLEAMARGLAEWRAVGSELGTTYFFALMADAQRTAGRLEEAWRSLDAADEIFQRTREGWWQPEVLRQRAELLARRGAPVTEIEQTLSSSLALARSRSASALSLRTAVTLAKLHVQQGRGDEARVLLRSGLAPFDQLGLDGNPDIPQARELERSLS